MAYETICTDANTGEVTVVPWTEEQIANYEADRLRYALEGLRTKRNALLEASDIMVLPDRWDAYSSAEKSAWADYRQALRDLPANTSDPFNPVWPTAPGGGN